MPATATPRKPQTLARKLVETRNTSRNRGLAAMLGLGESERDAIRSNASAVNDVYGRGTLAGFLGIPGDLGGLMWDAGAAVNNKIKDVEVALGLVSPKQARYVQSGGMAYGGAEHIGQKMQEYGLVSPTRRPKTELLASLISPTGLYATVAKAPQMARAGVRMLDNLAAPRTMGSQTGAIENLWHGSPNEFDAFDIGRSGETTDGGLLGRGVYLSTDRNVVRDGQNAYMVQADVSNPLRISLPNFKTDKKSVVTKALGLDESATSDEIASAARANGFDSVELDYAPTGYAHKEYAIFDADKTNILERNGQPVGNLGKMVAPQDEALRVAQQNAAKPIEEGGLGLRPDNTPEERAAAMGYNIDGYHGTNTDIPAFDNAKAEDGVHWFATHPDKGGQYAKMDRDGANVLPLRIRLDNPAGWEQADGRTLQDFSRLGYDGAYLPDGDLTTGFVTNPNQFRSRFAAFDPMRRDSSDLLAGLAPLGLGAWMYQDEPVK